MNIILLQPPFFVIKSKSILLDLEVATINNKELVEKLRNKYINNPPEGMTADEVKRMSDDDLLDMDYFLNEDVFNGLDGEDGFFIF